MKLIFLSLILAYFPFSLYAGGNPLDHTTSSNWPFLGAVKISPNGKFIAYKKVIGKSSSNFIVQAADGSWSKQLPNVYDGVFTSDSRRLISKNQKDSLGILTLGMDSNVYIPQVIDFKIPEEGDGRWLAYRMKGGEGSMVLLDMLKGTEKRFQAVSGYFLNRSGAFLILEQLARKDSSGPKTAVSWVNLVKGVSKTIFQTYAITQHVFNDWEDGMAFLTTDSVNGQPEICLRYYQEDMDSSRLVVGPNTPGMKGKIIKERDLIFSRNGKKVFFFIGINDAAMQREIVNRNGNVAIRATFDEIDRAEKAKDGPHLAVTDLNVSFNAVKELQDAFDIERSFFLDNDWIVTESNVVGERKSEKWRISARPDLYLISLKDGSRRLLKRKALYYDLSFSSSGKYVIWFDREERQWVSHDLVLDRTVNISGKIKRPLYREDEIGEFAADEGVAGWLENDEAVLIYDRNDIWQVDPTGSRLPVNVTGGYGARNGIRFRYIDINTDHHHPFRRRDTLLLSAFDLNKKYDGFFKLLLASRSVQKLILSPNCYNFRAVNFCGVNFTGYLGFSSVMKARDVNIYVACRMSSTEYPNLYITSNFCDFKQITFLKPQASFNWYTSELIRWKKFDGWEEEGILYKPEDFDPHKRYPIIFYYYERAAYALNYFIHPALSYGAMSIPWFVSNGYLVFVPDIHYKVGYPGKSAYNSVVSAALHLSKKPWVDSRRMGLQGHSFGGFETNYIVSHSSLFTAAAPASGVSNMINAYGEVDWGSTFHESGQGRIGASLWQRPDLYLENSSILNANKVTAAILIMHTLHDAVVPYSQGLQWYNALDRLGKRAWLLSYDKESHILHREEDRLDYSIRLGQFFDHFLKGMPAPAWMTQRSLSKMW